MQNVIERSLGCPGSAAAAQFKVCAAPPWFNPLLWSGTALHRKKFLLVGAMLRSLIQCQRGLMYLF